MALRDETRKALAQKVRPYLEQQARQGKTVTYGDLEERFSLPRQNIGEIVGEISGQEKAKGHPLLSAIVVRKDTGFPGAGFFGFADEEYLKWYPGETVTAAKRKARLIYALQEQIKVFSYWMP